MKKLIVTCTLVKGSVETQDHPTVGNITFISHMEFETIHMKNINVTCEIACETFARVYTYLCDEEYEVEVLCEKC